MRVRAVIDYGKLAHALQFYQDLGYEYIEVPWIVPQEIVEITRPQDAVTTKVVVGEDEKLGSFVSSAEQSFMYLMSQDKLTKGKPYVTVSPCFRHGDTVSPYHFSTFMKVELFKWVKWEDRDAYEEMVEDALSFMSSYCSILETHENCDTYVTDIETANHCIELGSYFFRKEEISGQEYCWVYGTGIAEPRLSQAIKTEQKGYHSKPIPKGVLGEVSKIREELLELEDAESQGVKVLVLCELADMIGATKHYLKKHHPSVRLEDLEQFANLTSNAFTSGQRK